MRRFDLWLALTALAAALSGCAIGAGRAVEGEPARRAAPPVIERVSTAVPFPRGLAVLDGELAVLARGRVRGAGGVTAAIEDRAGTIFLMDPAVSEPLDADPVGDAVRTNARVLAEPTAPPFRLWDRAADPPHADRLTDRPYCTLRYHAATHSLYLCAFSGVDKPRAPGRRSFSKNLTDALLRYDLRTRTWHEVERPDPQAGGNYPHHDPAHAPPPHGWLSGPDNCLPLGRWLYAVAKDNSVLVRYDLAALEADPHAAAPPSRVVATDTFHVRGHGVTTLRGHSALAYHGGYLYLGFRTSSAIIRLPVNDRFELEPAPAELVALFDPYDPATGQSADITDMGFDEQGRLYAVSAKPARVYRFTPDPRRVFDARAGRARPWADLAAATANPAMKSENLLPHNGWVYVTSGDGYGYQAGAHGTVYRIRIDD